MATGSAYPLRPKFGLNPDALQQYNQGPPAAYNYGISSPSLRAVQGTVGRMQAGVAAGQQRMAGLRQRMAMSPAASAAALGYNPQAGLGGVGGQYVGNPDARMGIGGIPFDPTRSSGQIGNMLMDPRQRNLGGGVPRAAGPDVEANGMRALQEMEDAGVGRIDPSTGMFLGPGATGLVGNARAQRVAGMIGRMPGGPGLPDDVAAGRQAFAAQRRADSLAERRGLVIQNAQMDREARRWRMGDLTVDEQVRLRNPMLAVEEARVGGLRDVANIRANADRDIAAGNVGLGREQIASNENLAGLDREVRMADIDMRRAAAKGDREAYIQAERRKTEAMDRASKASVDVARLNAGPAQTTADAAARSASAQEVRNYMEQANSLSERASAAYASGDYEEAERLGAQAQQMSQLAVGLMPPGTQAVPQPGITPPASTAKQRGLNTPRSWDQLHRDERRRYVTMGPEGMAAALRNDMPELSQTEMDAMVRAAFPGTTVSQYNPDGYGFTDFVGGLLGWENYNRFGRWASGGGPQPPTAPGGLGVPTPVLPGGIGVLQTYLGY